MQDPVLSSEYFWPMTSSNGMLTQDLVRGEKAILMHGARIVHNYWDRSHLSTEEKGSYVVLGDFKGV